MLRFNSINPIAQLIYFITVLILTMFTQNYILLLISLFGAVSYIIKEKGFKDFLKSFFGYIIIFLLVAVTNPLFSHKGTTPLFFVNDVPITLESLVYGMIMGLMILSTIMWFSVLNSTLTSEKITYIFGKTVPKLALLFSMTIHFVPDFIAVYKKILAVQSKLKNKNGLKMYINAFSSAVSVMLENSVELSDSMNSRGYGVKKRTFYSKYKFKTADIVFLIATIILSAITIILISQGYMKFQIYPFVYMSGFNAVSLCGYIVFAILSFIPMLIELKEEIKWKFSVSKI